MATQSKNSREKSTQLTEHKWSHHARVDVRSADIVDLIFEDHRPLKELIQILKDSDRPIEERQLAFESFAVELVAHAKPEEEVLYSRLKRSGELVEEAYEGDVEHGLADQMLEEAKRTKSPSLWSARVKVLAEMVEHHIEEEEDELLPRFKKMEDEETRSQLGDMFLQAKVKMLERGGQDAESEATFQH